MKASHELMTIKPKQRENTMSNVANIMKSNGMNDMDEEERNGKESRKRKRQPWGKTSRQKEKAKDRKFTAAIWKDKDMHECQG